MSSNLGPAIAVLTVAAATIIVTILRWRALRRPAAMVILALAVVAAVASVSSVGLWFLLPLIMIDWVLISSAGRSSAERRAAATEREHAARVAYVQQWQQAWSDANGGASPPEGMIPPAGFGSHPTGTNTMAILAIIFGFGGGLLGILFGHIALSQIRRTGEKGRGLAMTGLIFGYLGLSALIVIAIAVQVAVS